MNYSVGTLQKNMMAAMKGAWALAGIQVTTIPETFNVVYSTDSVCAQGCRWQMGWWGRWTYSPDFYPTGEVLFATGALSNAGSYSTPKADALIKKTDFTAASLTGYENYLAKNPPVLWLPHAEVLVEVHKGLHNPTQLNPLEAVTAALYRWRYGGRPPVEERRGPCAVLQVRQPRGVRPSRRPGPPPAVAWAVVRPALHPKSARVRQAPFVTRPPKIPSAGPRAHDSSTDRSLPN